MEDRLEAGLYLEMAHSDATTYASERVGKVSARPGVVRTTWWENVNPGRNDLPRRVPEFTVLGLYEVDATFEPPASPPGAVSLHFRRCPRPGQGRLTGRPTIGLSLVLISPRSPSGRQALRDWADFVHIRHIAEAVVPGYTMITPYENVTGGDPLFLHLYEMDTDEPEQAFSSMTPLVADRLGGGFGTKAFDEWATHPQLRIFYVNSFRRVGASPP